MIIPISSKKLQKYETYEATSDLALKLDGHPIRQMYRISLLQVANISSHVLFFTPELPIIFRGFGNKTSPVTYAKECKRYVVKICYATDII